MSNSLFICAVCGKVYEETCPTCPDRGNGRGATVQQIKDALGKCTNNAEVSACKQHYAPHIQRLRRHGGDARTMAIQIDNLVDYMRREVRRR